jgi:16S rRNA (guanine1207-N2)-methyltransferase
METLVVPQGEFELARFPVRKNDRLRAWDAADEYLLQHVADSGPTGGQPAVLVVNGGPGALAVGLVASGATDVRVMSDSYLDHVGTEENLRRNGFDPAAVTLMGPFGLDAPDAPPVDLVLLKIPKSSALLEDQLCRISPHLSPGAVVVAAAMSKHIHTSTLQLFERILGPTTTSLARKKARLVECSPAADREAATSPWPARIPTGGGGLVLVNHANVFSREKLDIGTRFLLDHLPAVEGPAHVVDLGCGNGVVGLAIAATAPEAHVTFVDESFMAVASANATYAENLGEDRATTSARFAVGDTLFHLQSGDPIERGSIDVVVNNPPFHDDHAVGDAIAWQMFTEAHGALTIGGELRVVGNRHLAYHAKLKRIFGNCRVVASNSKFVVYSALRT